MTDPGEKTRLLVLTSTFPRWEGDHEPPFVYELARRLTDRFRVTVLAPHTHGAATRENLGGVDVRRYRYAPLSLQRLAYDGGIPARLRSNPLYLLLVPLFVAGQFVATLRLVSELQPQAIHAHWLLPQGLLALLAGRFARQRPRIVVTAHGADAFGLNSGLARRLKRWVIRHADAVTVASRAVAEQIARLPGVGRQTQVLVMPMGVDLQERFVPKPARTSCSTLIFYGRLVQKKGVATLLKAMASVVETHPECRLLIAGGGPEERRLRALRDELILERQVEFLGAFENAALPAILERARIAVFPFEPALDGDREGLGLVTIEAMGCGMPVVVGDVAAVHDVVVHEQTGLIVPAGDVPMLADAIRRLLDDSELATCLGHNGRTFVLQRFDWQPIAKRYAATLTSEASTREPLDPTGN